MASSLLLGLCVIVVALCQYQAESQSVCNKENYGQEYMCVDWSFGSERMSVAQYNYEQESGEKVFFGVGSYGLQSNNNIGRCFKLSIDTTSTPIIMQVTNYGADIKDNQFDIQMGGGGVGVWNACIGRTDKTKNEADPCVDDPELDDIPVFPQFPGDISDWGLRCGGHLSRSGCENLPQMPSALEELPTPPGGANSEPDLITLCERSFDWGIRADGRNSEINSGEKIPCPQALIDVTGLKRSDDSFTYSIGTSGSVTATMDCCAPASSYPSATEGNNLLDDFNRLAPCDSGGYTRV